jgi:hypothetical protein
LCPCGERLEQQKRRKKSGREKRVQVGQEFSNPRSGHMGFVVDKVVLSILPLLIAPYSIIIMSRTLQKLDTDIVTK